MPELQRLVYRQCPFPKVNGIPCQADQLTGAQPRFEDQRILVIVVRASGRFQKDTLFFAGEELDVVCRTDRLGKPYPIHGMLGDEIVHLRRFQHRPHGDVRLTDGGSGIIGIHFDEYLFAVHGFHIRKFYPADHRLDVVLVSVTVVAERIGSQISDNILDPEIKPLIHRNIGADKNLRVCIRILCIRDPVSCFGNRLEVFLVPLTGSVYEPGAVQSVLPLVDTLTTFSAFEIFSHV